MVSFTRRLRTISEHAMQPVTLFCMKYDSLTVALEKRSKSTANQKSKWEWNIIQVFSCLKSSIEEGGASSGRDWKQNGSFVL